MKKIGDVFGIPVYSSKSVQRDRTYLIQNPTDELDKYFAVHPDDKDRFYDVVVNYLNTHETK